VRSVAFSPDGKRIVSGSDDNSLRLWDAVKGVPLNEPLTGHTGRVTSVAFAPDGKHLVSGSFDKAVRLWDADKGIALGEPIVDATSRFVTVAFSPDGRHVASGGGDKIVTILPVLDAWADSLCEKLPPPRRMTDAEWNKWVGNIPYATSRQCAG
jgi:WD40 repeat protein